MNNKIASFSKRVKSGIVDRIIVYFVTIFTLSLSFPFAEAIGYTNWRGVYPYLTNYHEFKNTYVSLGNPADMFDSIMITNIVILLVFIAIAYYIVASFYEREVAIGHRMNQLRFVTEDGEEVAKKLMKKRILLKIIMFPIWFVNLYLMYHAETKQPLYDQILRILVVEREELEE